MREATTTAFEYFGRDLESMFFARNYYDWMLGVFAPFVGSRILEVGAGTGTFTDELLKLEPQMLAAVEPSANMNPVLSRRFAGHKVVTTHESYLSDLSGKFNRRFDTVFYVNVMEHVPDDMAEVGHALDSLAPGGHLLIFVPAMPWLFGSADRLFGHHRRYTKQTLGALFQDRDVSIMDCRYFDLLGVLPWWASFVWLQKQALSPWMVKLYDRVVVPFASRLEDLVEPPLGKNLLLVARKSDD